MTMSVFFDLPTCPDGCRHVFRPPPHFCSDVADLWSCLVCGDWQVRMKYSDSPQLVLTQEVVLGDSS